MKTIKITLPNGTVIEIQEATPDEVRRLAEPHPLPIWPVTPVQPFPTFPAPIAPWQPTIICEVGGVDAPGQKNVLLWNGEAGPVGPIRFENVADPRAKVLTATSTCAHGVH